jgi:DNA ligase-1
MKLEVVVELKVVGYNEGRNKYVGMLGSLACESEDGKVKVNVAGFTDKQRQEIWDERGLNIIAVKSNSIMPPENKEHYSLFLPIFVEERLDKKKADTLEQIQAQFEAAVTA